ncbi:ABC transporter ATP-binding protein [Rhodococcus opacus]
MSTALEAAEFPDNGRPSPILEARDVAVHYGGIKAVDGISFELASGKIYGILGPNGSGKSTLLAALTGLVKLTRGSISLGGQELRSSSPVESSRRGVSRTFQTARLVPGLTVLQNVQLGADQLREDSSTRPKLGGRAGRFQRRRFAASQVESAIERTGLTGLEAVRPSELPYGTQRRVEIARAIAMAPDLLLLDEPTAGMNSSERLEISSLLQQLRSEGLTQVLVEHDVQMMVDTCDHLLALNLGVLIAEGSAGDVVREPAVREAYLGKRWQDHA